MNDTINFNLYNKVAIKPNSLCFFYQSDRARYYPEKDSNSMKNLANNQHNGIVSKKASKKINTAIDWLIAMAEEKNFRTYKNRRKYKHYLSFITLTLPSKQVHSDNDIKNKCLNQFLIEAKKHWQILHYIWKAEAQSNGNIHFHITTDKFIPHTQLRDVWNRIVSKLGYIDNYRSEQVNWHKNGFRVRTNLLKSWKLDAQRKAYKRGIASNWLSPNSTDIHSVRNISNLGAYLKKYFAKNEDKRAIEGRLWGVSRVLGSMRSVIVESCMVKKWHMKEFCKNVYNKAKSFDFFRVLFVGWYEVAGYFDEVCDYLYKDYIGYFKNLKPDIVS